MLAIYFFNKLSAHSVQRARADSSELNQTCFFPFLALSPQSCSILDGKSGNQVDREMEQW